MNEIVAAPDILTPVNLGDIADPTPGTANFDAAKLRDERTRDVSTMTWLPQLPDLWAMDLYERIEAAEREFAAPNFHSEDYVQGTAIEPDEIAVVGNLPGYLFTAEHATSTVRAATGKIGFPDAGTAGLAAVLGEEHGKALIMRGLQQGNPATDPEHPIKPLIAENLQAASGFLSVHGKSPNMFVRPTDKTEIHAIIGLGANPDGRLHDFARKIVIAARDELGLYVTIGNDQHYYIQKPKSTELKRNEDGTAKTNTLAAIKPNSTTNFARNVLAKQGKQAPAFQVELTHLLRMTPLNTNEKDTKSRVMGVALGYLLLEKMVTMAGKSY